MNRQPLNPDFVVVSGETMGGNGSFSYILTGTDNFEAVEEICEKIEDEYDVYIECYRLKQFIIDMEKNEFLTELKNSDNEELDSCEFEDVDVALLTADKLMLAENESLLYQVLRCFFNFRCAGGILPIMDFVVNEIPVLLTSDYTDCC